jgi:hypothetical protein
MVLFATHGVHFDETNAAHSLFRQTVLALKNRESGVPIQARVAAKKLALALYQSSMAVRRGHRT